MLCLITAILFLEQMVGYWSSKTHFPWLSLLKDWYSSWTTGLDWRCSESIKRFWANLSMLRPRTFLPW